MASVKCFKHTQSSYSSIIGCFCLVICDKVWHSDPGWEMWLSLKECEVKWSAWQKNKTKCVCERREQSVSAEHSPRSVFLRIKHTRVKKLRAQKKKEKKQQKDKKTKRGNSVSPSFFVALRHTPLLSLSHLTNGAFYIKFDWPITSS